jgi:hypothetical protein
MIALSVLVNEERSLCPSVMLFISASTNYLVGHVISFIFNNYKKLSEGSLLLCLTLHQFIWTVDSNNWIIN